MAILRGINAWKGAINKMVLLLLFTITLSYSCKVRANRLSAVLSDSIDSTVKEQRILLKEFALCECLIYGYKNTPVANDISLPIYYNELLYGENIIDSISIKAKKFADKIPTSDHVDYDKQKPIIAACIQWYKSKELDSLVKSYDKSLDIWIDKKEDKLINSLLKKHH